MIIVKFFGLISVDYNLRQLTLKDGKVSHILNEIVKLYPNISRNQLMQCTMFVNNKPIHGKKDFSMVLKDGDELALLSPSSGG